MMYKTSKDYEKLWELGMNSKIIAIYEEVKTKGFCFITPSYNNVLIYSFGQELGRFQKEVDFIDCCKRYNLEFIDPTPNTCELCEIERIRDELYKEPTINDPLFVWELVQQLDKELKKLKGKRGNR